MPIVVGDLKLFAAEYQNDEVYGGGRMTGTVVQDGVENNLFPDIDAAARSAGRVQMRKLFAAVASANVDTFSGAQLRVREKPTDAAVGVVVFAHGDSSTLRAAAAAALGTLPYVPVDTGDFSVPSSISGATITVSASRPVGTLLGTYTNAGGAVEPAFLRSTHAVTAVSGAGPFVLTLSPSPSAEVFRYAPMRASVSAPRVCGVVLSTAASGASLVAVESVEAQVTPTITPYPTVVVGFAPAGLAASRGKVPIFRPGEPVVIRNGATSEVAVVLSVDYAAPSLTFTAPLVGSYASGSTVSSLVGLGDLKASIGASFSQQTWTKVFRDTLIGNTIDANYNRTLGAITTSNVGGITERWAIVFTSATAFKLVGEGVGQIATGTTAIAFSPANPFTGSPYFTIPTAGWGAGWAIGNVLRFNTIGASAPVWAARTVSPSAPGAVDGATLELRGSVDA
jgi:hypothetical protein